jgi:hypothetical protein
MDQKKFEEKLNQIAVWTYPSVSKETSLEKIISPRDEKKRTQCFTPKPDMGPRIIEVFNNKSCNWCGKQVEQKQNITKTFDTKTGEKKWQYNCYNCHRIWDPELGNLKPVSKSLASRQKKLKKLQK